MNNDNNIKKWFQENGDRVELILELLLATIIAMIIASSVSKMEAKILYFARIEITLFVLIIPFWHVRHDILPHIINNSDSKDDGNTVQKLANKGTLISVIIGCITGCIFCFVCYLYVGIVGIAIGIGFGLKEYVSWKMFFIKQKSINDKKI